MEDRNMLAADCLVISCCCQCLLLQILIFIVLKLPCKLVQKTKEFAKKKLQLRCRKKANKGIESLGGRFGDEFDEFVEGSITVQVEEFHGSHGCGSCMQQVERVLEELSQKGEFSFGSFWGRGSSSRCAVVAKQEFDLSLVQFEFVDIPHSLKFSN